MTRKNIYFVSDIHLGFPSYKDSRPREKLFVQWLSEVGKDAAEIYLLGDVFDFWWEYKSVVPRGYTRLLGKISELTDQGIPVHFFTGNHDLWIRDYLPEETGIILHKEPVIKKFGEKYFYLAHGDGLGDGDYGYKVLKWIFTNSFLQWLFSRLHPNFSMGFGNRWSVFNRTKKGMTAKPFQGEEKELLVQFAKKEAQKLDVEYFIFGHRHIPLDLQINDTTRMINLGDWLVNFTYAVFDGEDVALKKFLQTCNS